MAENTGKAAEKTQQKKMKKWVDGLKSEFNKIIWPDTKTLGKQTTAVVIVSVVLGVLITIIDLLVQYGVDFLVK
ncbi:MAG: preprotein translocase subunit SecE [Lachnospiraceae bacterium]|nr:preprotein translocase subunit SecE [Robinsoniella sp.]MDY3765135.1 preprotein translocase subunit SecE [Lachnospiraceae bacterium]